MKLGHWYRDQITGFAGIAIGHCAYLTGCNQTLLQPRGSDPNVRPDSQWFDDQRLQLIAGDAVTLDNGTTPGFDKPAPKA